MANVIFIFKNFIISINLHLLEAYSIELMKILTYS